MPVTQQTESVSKLTLIYENQIVQNDLCLCGEGVFEHFFRDETTTVWICNKKH